MDNLTGADNIRKEMEEKMASGKLAKKKTMSVPEMRKLLGVKKTESYWLVHRNFSRRRSSMARCVLIWRALKNGMQTR